ncbi:MAG: hypothetical protein KDK70_06285 [Myxococcales bacterium]|nr:hypothetical protein [Myxococcales bacterium]
MTARVTEGWAVDTTNARWLETAPALPRVEVFSEPDGSTVLGPNLLTSADALKTGTTHHVVDIHTPGRFIVRLGGEGQGPWSLEVSVVRQGDIQPPDALLP